MVMQQAGASTPTRGKEGSVHAAPLPASFSFAHRMYLKIETTIFYA